MFGFFRCVGRAIFPDTLCSFKLFLRDDLEFGHVYSSKETEESYTVRCSIIQPGQQSLFDNEHTVYETVKVGEADGVLGTSTDEHGKNVYTLSWEHRGITHTVMGNIPYDEIMKIAEGIR